MVEEEKQEHVDKVKELLGWAVGLKQSMQGRTAAAQSRELGDIEKSISEQQVGRHLLGPPLTHSCYVSPVLGVTVLFGFQESSPSSLMATILVGANMRLFA